MDYQETGSITKLKNVIKKNTVDLNKYWGKIRYLFKNLTQSKNFSLSNCKVLRVFAYKFLREHSLTYFMHNYKIRNPLGSLYFVRSFLNGLIDPDNFVRLTNKWHLGWIFIYYIIVSMWWLNFIFVKFYSPYSF